MLKTNAGFFSRGLSKLTGQYSLLRSLGTLTVSLHSLKRDVEEHLCDEVKLIRMHGSGACLVFAVLGLEGKPLAALKVASRWRERRACRVNILKSNFLYLEPAQRFSREYEILKTLAPHDLAPRPLGATEHYLLQAYVEGPLVAELLHRKDPQGKYWWFEALKALRAIHSLGISHGDARPTNVIVSSGSVKFFDFEHYIDPEIVTWEQQQTFDILRYLINTFNPQLVEDGAFGDFGDEVMEFLKVQVPEAIWREFPVAIDEFGLQPTPFLNRLLEEVHS